MIEYVFLECYKIARLANGSSIVTLQLKCHQFTDLYNLKYKKVHLTKFGNVCAGCKTTET